MAKRGNPPQPGKRAGGPGTLNGGGVHIGARIRRARLDRGLSQGDLERRTGLLRCYLSRVENGHTEPSLPTLARLANALEMPLVAFFDAAGDSGAPVAPPHPALASGLSAEELAFLQQMRQFAGALSERGRQRVLALAERMAQENAAAPKPV